MKAFRKRRFVAVLATVCALTCLGGEETAAGGQELRVRICNYAGVAPHTLRAARADVDRLFRQCGIELVWLESANNGLTADVYIRIVASGRAYRDGQASDSFGFALYGAEHSGELATVFYDRVAELTRRGPEYVSERVILAHVIAHELGHLLLGPGSHARRGIMSARWSRQDLVAASEGYLNFNPGERARMAAIAQATR